MSGEGGRVPEIRRENLLQPDETIEFDHGHMTSVRIGDLTVGYDVCEPGWRWSTHVKPLVGTEWCMSRHVGFQLSGRWGLLLQDGTTMELGPNDVFDVPAGHDARTIGDEPSIALDWEGLRTWATPIGVGERVLVTILFTDIVDSTTTAENLGGRRSDLLARHNEPSTSHRDHRGRGQDVATASWRPSTVRRARARGPRIRTATRSLGLDIASVPREVDLVGRGPWDRRPRGGAGLAAAGSGEILVTDVTRAQPADRGQFEDRGPPPGHRGTAACSSSSAPEGARVSTTPAPCSALL
jgi:hypothetical protein